MDSFNPQQTQLDLSKLSDFEKRELQQNLQNEMQKAKIQECMPLPFPPYCPNPAFTSARLHPSLSVSGFLLIRFVVLAVHNLTDICWTKCMTKGISSGKLDRGEESCTQNCVDRFLDANEAVLKQLNAMRGGGGM